MKLYTIKIPAKRWWYPVKYELEQDKNVQSYEDFCYLKSLCDPVPELWEIVRVNIDGKRYIMLVDESGLYHDCVPNPVATALHKNPFDVPVVGDVFFLNEYESECLWLTEKDVDRIAVFYETGVTPFVPFYFENKQLRASEKK